ncbi:MAG: hypothetical protein HY327_06110 [Chloroflexi bacterium]|nr:hypothetical protein [Chloroflexota bacterium]
MAISFSRSMRSLHGDSFRPSLATLIVASILIAAWMAWLVFAPVTLYETSQDWQVQRDGSLIVRFPAETIARFRPGQPATLAIQADPNEPPQQLKAIVADIPSRTQNRLASDTVKVTLLSNALPKGTSGGEVKIEVERVSPLTLITRASGQLAAR